MSAATSSISDTTKVFWRLFVFDGATSNFRFSSGTQREVLPTPVVTEASGVELRIANDTPATVNYQRRRARRALAAKPCSSEPRRGGEYGNSVCVSHSLNSLECIDHVFEKRGQEEPKRTLSGTPTSRRTKRPVRTTNMIFALFRVIRGQIDTRWLFAR